MGSDAIDLYRQMPEEMRNAVTHICVLNACSQAGLVDQGRQIFDQINVKTEKIVTVMVSWLFNDWNDFIDQWLDRLSLSNVHLRRGSETPRGVWKISSTIVGHVQWVTLIQHISSLVFFHFLFQRNALGCSYSTCSGFGWAVACSNAVSLSCRQIRSDCRVDSSCQHLFIHR